MGAMFRYHIDSAKLRQIVVQRGYAHVTEFAKLHGFNRATINNYLKGQGGPFSEVYYVICDALQIDPLSILSPLQAGQTVDADEVMPIVKKICAFDKDIAVGLLGSRAKGSGRKYSDWDLCITRGARTLTGGEFLRSKRSVDDEVDKLPREVDIINLDAAPEWFLVGLDYEPVFLAGNSNSWSYFMGVLYGTKKRKEDR